MDIILYKFNKRENSTKQPSSGLQIHGNLNSPSSIMNPSIKFSSTRNYYDYNYAYIDKFKRYYYITDWIYENGLWVANMMEDVLSTYKNDIGNSNQYVTRSSYTFDTDVIDTLYPTKANVENTTISESLWIDYSEPIPDLNINQYFILGIIGNSTTSDTGIVTYYQMDSEQFTHFSNMIFGTTDYLGGDFGSQTLDWVKAQVNPFQYIVSLYKYPFKISITQKTEIVKIGWWSVNQSCDVIINAASWFNKSISINVPSHPQINRGKYLDNSPYSVFSLYIPGFGTKVIPSEYLYKASEIIIKITVEVTSNKCYCYLKAKTDNTTYQFMQFAGTVGQTVTIGQSVSNTLGAIESVVGIAASAATGNVLGVASSVGNFIESRIPKLSTSGVNSGEMEWYDNVVLLCSYTLVCDDDNANNGKPLMQNKTLNTIPGYIKCENADISIAGVSTENEKIKNYLNGGFFYE